MEHPAGYSCPWCGEWVDSFADTSAGSQQYVEDCQVCCRPIIISLSIDTEGFPILNVQRE
tara:strand:+ start:1085 stop:1264 length:180 start_codon:yes stop_codon:yes gene_type:complete